MTLDRFTRSEQKRSFSELSMLLYGWPKTGKSTLASMFRSGDKEPLFLTTEDRHHALDVMHERLANWAQFRETARYIYENREEIKESHSCLVFDLVSDLNDWSADTVLAELSEKMQMRVSDIGEFPNALGYTAQRKEFQKWIGAMLNIMPCVFIAHTKDKKLSLEGVEVEQQAPDLPPRIIKWLNGKVDMIGFIVPSAKTKSNPVLTFRPNKMAWAGSAFSHMAREFELNPEDMAGSYAAIEKAYQGEKND